MFQANQSGKDYAAEKERRLLSGQDNRQDQDPIEEAIVLKVDVVNDQQAGGEQDG